MKHFSLIILLLVSQASFAQEVIELVNPSFEDLVGAGKTPAGWYDCGREWFVEETPPDIQPGKFDVDKIAQDGATYLGLIARENNTWEGISQRLHKALKTGTAYQFSLQVSRSADYWSAVPPDRVLSAYADMKIESKWGLKKVNHNTPIVLRIWGAYYFCEEVELLYESLPIKDEGWQELNIVFEPENDIPYLIFEAYYDEDVGHVHNGNLLIDNLSNIVEIVDVEATKE